MRVGGLLTALRETRTRRGALMAFGTLEDLEGSFDLVIFSDAYARHGSLLKSALEGRGGGRAAAGAGVGYAGGGRDAQGARERGTPWSSSGRTKSSHRSSRCV